MLAPGGDHLLDARAAVPHTLLWCCRGLFGMPFYVRSDISIYPEHTPTMARSRAGGRRGHRAALPRRFVTLGAAAPTGGQHELDRPEFRESGHAHARCSRSTAG